MSKGGWTLLLGEETGEGLSGWGDGSCKDSRGRELPALSWWDSVGRRRVWAVLPSQGTQASGAGPAAAGLIPAEQHSQWRVSYASPVAVQKVMCGVQATI